MTMAQWYLTREGAWRLRQELEAVRLFNAQRLEQYRIVGRRHPEGHLIFEWAFLPLDSWKQPPVQAEMILSSQHPHHHPVARIKAPALKIGGHLLAGTTMRTKFVAETIPLDWATAAGATVPCMYTHGGPDGWRPDFTAVQAVLNVQTWFLNYLVWRQTDRWPLDQEAA